MDNEQRCVYVSGMIANAQIKAMGMMAENQYLQSIGSLPKYREEDFNKLIDDTGIYHNSLITEISGH